MPLSCSCGKLFNIFALMFQNLKDVLANMVPEKQAEVKKFRQEHGKTKVGEVNVDMVRRPFFQLGI